MRTTSLSRISRISRIIVLILWLGTLVHGLSSCDDPAHRPYSVGIHVDNQTFEPTVEGFKVGMAELGYKEGDNIRYLIEITGDNAENATESRNVIGVAIDRLLSKDIDLLLTTGNQSASVAKLKVAGTHVPVLFAPTIDPVGNELVADIQHPGGQLTGIRAGGFVAKELEWLVTIAPDIKKVFAPFATFEHGSRTAIKQAQSIAKKLDIELITQALDSEAKITALAANLPTDIDAIFLVPGVVMALNVAAISQAAVERKLPVVFHHHHRLKEGLLLSFGPELFEIGRQAAHLAQQIFNGASPSELPVEIAEFSLGINLKIAKAIDVEIPDHLLRRAKHIVR